MDPAGDSITDVDATGMTCPMPVIELSQAIAEIEVGARVRLLATDPTARVDVPVWCRMRRHRLIALEENAEEGVLRFLVERAH